AALSGGERQRAAIARALFNGPDLILADEPTGNLDAANAAQVLDLLASLNARGLTLVMVTHDPGVARRAGRVLDLAAGRLAPAPGPARGTSARRHCWWPPCNCGASAACRRCSAPSASPPGWRGWCWRRPSGRAPGGRWKPPSVASGPAPWWCATGPTPAASP